MKSLEDTIKSYTEDFFKEKATLKQLIKPGEENAALGVTLLQRIKIPALVVVLLALIGNYLLFDRFTALNHELSTQLQLVQQHAESEKHRVGQQQKLITQFNQPASLRYALLCDRIAATLPDHTKLTQLSIFPLKKTDMGKGAVTDPNKITISGESSDAKHAADFLTNLQREFSKQRIHMISVIQQRETNLFEFIIEIKL